MVDINGEAFYRYTWTHQGQGEHYVQVHNNYLVDLHITSSDTVISLNNFKAYPIIKNILSTFKFTNTDSTAWKTSIDLIKCVSGESRILALDLGSKSISVLGLNNGNCVMEYINETEGGYTKYSCKIPVSVLKIFPSELENSKFCTVIKTGNFLLDQQR